MRELEPITPAPMPAPARPPALRPTRLVGNGKSGLPDGLIALEAFAKQHRIAITTAKKAAAAGRLPIIEGEWRARGTLIRKCLDKSGQHRFVELFQNIASFTPCDQCPHSI